MLGKTLQSPLNCKEIHPVHPKGDQSWIFIGRTDAEVETLILWPPDVKNWLIGKDLDAGKDWRQEEKGMTEDEMVEWHHWLNGHEFEQTPGDSEGQGSLACCSPWGIKSWTRLATGQQGISEHEMTDINRCFCFPCPFHGGSRGDLLRRCQISDFTLTFHFHALEKEMAIHSSVLAWRIPGMAEPGLPSMGLHRVGHDWSDLAAAADICENIYLPHREFLYNSIPLSKIVFYQTAPGWRLT